MILGSDGWDSWVVEAGFQGDRVLCGIGEIWLGILSGIIPFARWRRGADCCAGKPVG